MTYIEIKIEIITYMAASALGLAPIAELQYTLLNPKTNVYPH
jgi:hypothetical protein